jgi:chorismate-pyruvate lyase
VTWRPTAYRSTFRRDIKRAKGAPLPETSLDPTPFHWQTDSSIKEILNMTLHIRRAFNACAILSFLAGTVSAADSTNAKRTPAWRDDFIARLEATALLETLNADLLSHESATLTLDRWCDSHRLTSPAKIVAELVKGADKVPSDEQRKELRVGASEPVRYRHVRLHCGDYVLSEADNWYLPARLTADMNRELDTTNVAFGRAVQALHFSRHTLSAKLLWTPLPQGWESATAAPGTSSGTLEVPEHVIEHRAVLTLPDGTPFSDLVETYTSEVLAFAEPPRP